MTAVGASGASTALKIGLAVAGVGVGAWALTRVLNDTSPGDDYPTDPGGSYPGGTYPADPGYPGDGGYIPSNPGGSTSPGDDYPTYPTYPTYPSDPGGGYYPTDPYPGDPGGYYPDPSYPTYPTYPDYPTYPTYPTYPSGGMYNAVQNAAPFSWSSSDVAQVVSAAQAGGRSTYDAAEMVREVYRSTPYSWSPHQEARVAATGLITGASPYETGDVIDAVEWASNWGTSSDVRLAVAALEGHVNSGSVGSIIRSSYSVGEAESRLRSGGYGGSYPTYPTPGYPGGTSPGDDW